MAFGRIVISVAGLLALSCFSALAQSQAAQARRAPRSPSTENNFRSPDPKFGGDGLIINARPSAFRSHVPGQTAISSSACRNWCRMPIDRPLDAKASSVRETPRAALHQDGRQKAFINPARSQAHPAGRAPSVSFTAPGPVSCTREISARSQRGRREELRGCLGRCPAPAVPLSALLLSSSAPG